MSKTWERKIAHAKAKKLGIKKPNKERINPMNGRKMPSWFAVNWRRVGAMEFTKPPKRKKNAAT